MFYLLSKYISLNYFTILCSVYFKLKMFSFANFYNFILKKIQLLQTICLWKGFPQKGNFYIGRQNLIPKNINLLTFKNKICLVFICCVDLDDFLFILWQLCTATNSFSNVFRYKVQQQELWSSHDGVSCRSTTYCCFDTGKTSFSIMMRKARCETVRVPQLQIFPPYFFFNFFLP